MKMYKMRIALFAVLSVFCVSAIGGCDCFTNNKNTKEIMAKFEKRKKIKNEKYGTYLAGRVAHLRKDFNTAADNYIEVLRKDPQNEDLVAKVYVILTSEGRISEAAEYAKISVEKGDENNFTYIIIAVDEVKKQKYDEALATASMLKGPVYDEFINPLLTAWIKVGKNDLEGAVSSLDSIKREAGLEALYNFHIGLIYDYFDKTEEADKHYSYLINEAKQEVTFRALQVISNFYVRSGQKDKAIELVEKYKEAKIMPQMFDKLYSNIVNANPETTMKIISSADSGLAEALFSIASTLRQGPAGADLAHIFISLSIHSNPDYDLSKLLLADILESREMYDNANKLYDTIDKEKETYYIAQLKKATNYTIKKDYETAVKILKKLISDGFEDYQSLLDLADNLRMLKKYDKAIYYYNKAIDSLDEVEENHWVAFYALGVAYERSGDWENAEKNLKKAIELSDNHYIVTNYLGYYWISKGENVEEALNLIISAYNQAPNDGHIIDSLGWALYKLGEYDVAVNYLEKASVSEPANALISDHLGDAYWRAGRKIEAVFQWKHSLVLKQDIEEVDIENVKKKIEDGLGEEEPAIFDKETIVEKIKYL